MAKAHYGLSLAYQELGNTSGLLEEYRISNDSIRAGEEVGPDVPAVQLFVPARAGCPLEV
jgi:hypothetical protein